MQVFKSNHCNRFNLIGKVAVTGFVLAAISTATFAADRVIEESLVYKDPTVAQQNQWVKGVSVDYWSVNLEQPTPFGANIKMQAQQPGISAFIGYGDISVLASYRTGSLAADLNTVYLGNAISIHSTEDESESEIDVRWLLSNFQSNYLTPYVLVGYFENSWSGTTTGTVNGTPITPTSFSGSDTIEFVGAGAIIPVNERIGFRTDAKYGWVSWGNETQLKATMYYNIAEGWNVQLGARLLNDTYSNGSSSIQATGAYAMLGYTFR